MYLNTSDRSYQIKCTRYYKNLGSWAWQHTHVIPALWKTEVGDYMFDSSMDNSNLVRPHLKIRGGRVARDLT